MKLNADGKPEDPSYLELGLPVYLQYDIDQLKKGIQEQCSYVDCLYDEVYGSINSAYWDQEINAEQARYLRKKYLGIESEAQ